MTIGTGLWPSACPTARLPCGWPMRRAISPYETALPERDTHQPRLAGGHEYAADRGGDGAVIDGAPRRGAGVPVQLLERRERPAIGAELAPALERTEPARQRRRAAPIAEQEGDQVIFICRHRASPSAARSFLSAWYTLARAATSLPPSEA